MSLKLTVTLQGDHSACAKPLVDFKTKVLLWLGLPWLGQNGTFVLKSTGGFVQAEWSPCIHITFTMITANWGQHQLCVNRIVRVMIGQKSQINPNECLHCWSFSLTMKSFSGRNSCPELTHYQIFSVSLMIQDILRYRDLRPDHPPRPPQRHNGDFGWGRDLPETLPGVKFSWNIIAKKVACD